MPDINALKFGNTTYNIQGSGGGGGSLIMVDCGTITTLPVTITDSRIKANHIVIAVDASNKYGVAGDWTVTTSDGSLTISGLVVAASVAIKLYLAEVAV